MVANTESGSVLCVMKWTGYGPGVRTLGSGLGSAPVSLTAFLYADILTSLPLSPPLWNKGAR